MLSNNHAGYLSVRDLSREFPTTTGREVAGPMGKAEHTAGATLAKVQHQDSTPTSEASFIVKAACGPFAGVGISRNGHTVCQNTLDRWAPDHHRRSE